MILGVGLLGFSLYLLSYGVNAFLGILPGIPGFIILAVAIVKFIDIRSAKDYSLLIGIGFAISPYLLSPLTYVVVRWVFGYGNLHAFGSAAVVYVTLYSISEYLIES